jgi:hypothetical protein
MVCVRVFIELSARTCMSICVCTVFLKKKFRSLHLALARAVPAGLWAVRIPSRSPGKILADRAEIGGVKPGPVNQTTGKPVAPRPSTALSRSETERPRRIA